MRVFVRFQVPVLVEVDLNSGSVVSVVVDDERATGIGEAFTVDGELGADERRRAIEVAEITGWPAWRFG